VIIVPVTVAAGLALRSQTARWRRRLEPVGFDACLNCGHPRGGRPSSETCARCGAAPFCLKCGYPRAGLPLDHACPECGEPFDESNVANTWRRHLYA